MPYIQLSGFESYLSKSFASELSSWLDVEGSLGSTFPFSSSVPTLDWFEPSRVYTTNATNKMTNKPKALPMKIRPILMELPEELLSSESSKFAALLVFAVTILPFGFATLFGEGEVWVGWTMTGVDVVVVSCCVGG